MATVTGYTAERMREIENTTVVDGDVIGDDLVLIQRNGAQINAGSVRGPQGIQGTPGSAAVQIVTNATIPSAPEPGHVIFNSDTGTESFWDGTKWVQAIPSGMLMPAAIAVAPLGWLVCDGRAVSRTTYALLFAALGVTYGAGDSSTTFNLPNLKGKFLVGHDAADASFDGVGKTGGEKTHVLTPNEMPAHTHAQVAHAHNPSYPALALNPSGGLAVQFGNGVAETAIPTNNTTAVNQNTGGNAPHNTLPPFTTILYLVKT